MRFVALLVLSACATAPTPLPGRALNMEETGAVHVTLHALYRHGFVLDPRCNDDLRALRMDTVPHEIALRARCNNTTAYGCVDSRGVIWTAETQDEITRAHVVVHEVIHLGAKCATGESDSYHLDVSLWRIRDPQHSVEALARELLR